MQRLGLLIVIAMLPACGPLRAILAPESVLAGSAQQVGGGVTQAVDGIATQQAIRDVDRIIDTRGDASNRDELERLKSDLEANPLATTNKRRIAPRREAPPRDFDRRHRPSLVDNQPFLMDGQAGLRMHEPGHRRGHRLIPQGTVGSTHRGDGEPFATSRGHLLPPSGRKLYDLDYSQVRVPAPTRVEPRR